MELREFAGPAGERRSCSKRTSRRTKRLKKKEIVQKKEIAEKKEVLELTVQSRLSLDAEELRKQVAGGRSSKRMRRAECEDGQQLMEEFSEDGQHLMEEFSDFLVT